MRPLRTLAFLLRPLRSETPYGGRATTYEDMGMVWLEAGRSLRRERVEADVARDRSAMSAVVRADPRLAEGLILRFGGGDWSIVGMAVDAARPGRVTLNLEAQA